MRTKQCVVIGLGRFGLSVAETLSKLGNEVLAIDISEEPARYVKDSVAHSMQADITDEEVINTLGLNDFDIGVVAIGENLESSSLAILALKKSGVKHIIAKAKDERYGKILLTLGADKVIYPERDMGCRVAHNIHSSNIIDFFEFSKEYSIVEIAAPKFTYGKTIEELKVREKYNLNIIAIKTNDNINADVKRNTILKENDILILVGKDKDILKFQ